MRGQQASRSCRIWCRHSLRIGVPVRSGPRGCESGEQKDSVMNVRIAPGLARPGARALAFALTTTVLAIALGSTAFAQAPPAAQPAPKAQPKQQPQPKGPAAQQKPAEPQPAPEAQQPQLIYSPWTKFCL